MFTIYYYPDHTLENGMLIHDLNGGKEVILSSGKGKLTYGNVDTFEFTINSDNREYSKIQALKGLVKVFKTMRGQTQMVFFGRILKPISEMTQGGMFYQSYICEDLMGYLNDSSQTYAKVANNGLRDFFSRIITRHNSVVEPHKQFKVGQVTVESDSDIPFRYIGYDSTFETIKKYCIDAVGGVIRIRYESDGMYIDWLKEYGNDSETALRAGDNLQMAKRETNFEDVITRLTPLGATIDNQQENETGIDTTQQQIGISAVNSGKDYIEDTKLIEKFGIINRSMTWSDIDSASVLLSRGRQYMAQQQAILISWNVRVVDMSLIDSRYDGLAIGNTYLLQNPLMAGDERLKVIEQSFDIQKPQSLDLVIGANNQSLSAFQNQMKEATQSIDAVKRRQLANEKEQLAKQKALMDELNRLNQELMNATANNSSTVTELEQKIAAIEAQLAGGA